MHILWKRQDTSTKIAGNDNIRNDENPEGGKHPIKGGQIGDETLNTSHPLNGRKSIPRWTPPTLGFDILNRNRPPMMVRPAPTVTQTAHKQVHIKEEPRSITTKERAKMFFLQGRNTLLPDLPGTEANGPQASK